MKKGRYYKNGEQVALITVSQAVYDNETGRTVKQDLDAIGPKINQGNGSTEILVGKGYKFAHGSYQGAGSNNLAYLENSARLRAEFPSELVSKISIASGYSFIVAAYEDVIPTTKCRILRSSFASATYNVSNGIPGITNFNPNRIIIAIKNTDDTDLSGITSIDDIITITPVNTTLNKLGDVAKRSCFASNAVQFTNNSITFPANSKLYIFEANNNNSRTITFAEETSITCSNDACILLRNGELTSVTAYSEILDNDVLLLKYSNARSNFIDGLLYPQYLGLEIEGIKDDVSELPTAAAIENLSEKVDDNLYASLNGTVEGYKKIESDGSITSATGDVNRTLSVDVSELVGETLMLDGRLYASSSGYSYCWWVFYDENDNVLTKSETSGSSAINYTNVEVVVPEGAKTLYVQGSSTSVFPSARAGIRYVVENLDTSSEKSTKKFELDFACLDRSNGRVATSSTYTNAGNKHTIDYIKVHKTIKIYNLGGTKCNVRIFYYDANMALFDSTLYSDTTDGLTSIEVDSIPNGAVWFRVGFAILDSNVSTITPYLQNYVEIESEWDNNDTCKEPYKEYTPFLYSVCCNIPEAITSNPSIKTKQVFAYDEGLIHLPSSYTPDGRPTPLIIFLHGDAERYTIGESTFSGHMKMQQCWADMGFAQMDLDLIPSCYNSSTLAGSGGTRDDLECLAAAWDYVTNHFNIDNRGFYLIGRSRGGQAVFEALGKGWPNKLPIIAAVSMAGANSMFEYSVQSVASENEWQLWCNAHGLPTTNRPRWSDSASYSTNKSFLNDEDCYNFVVNNFDLWWRKALTGWSLITKNENGITPRNYFDNISYKLGLKNSGMGTSAEIEAYFQTMIDTMEAKSPVPLRLDWCVGDTIQSREYFTSPHSYASVFSDILLNTPASNVEYRRWDSVDETNPYGETNPHYAENMIFYDGDLTLPNGVVVSNPSKVTVEWMLWCMGHDPRFHITDYSLPDDW